MPEATEIAAARPPARIVPQSLRRQAEDGLRRAIMDGVFAPGAHLADRVLCERLGVSRSVVREAVRLLEAEGWVTLAPHRGHFVARLSAAEAAQVYEVRGALEALAGAGFATRAAAEDRAALRHAFEAMRTPPEEAGRHALVDMKRRFYAVLLRGCGNAHVARMLEQILDRNNQLRATSLSAPDRWPHTLREIERIVEAVERGDADGARQACLDHVEAAAAVALAILRGREERQTSA